MKKVNQFFWWCSGAHQPTLEKCPSETSKYVGIGATVLFTGIFAAIACSYALYTVFDSALIASCFGLIWGLMIFNLDRYIVSSMRKDQRSSRELKMAAPRLVLAILISIVIVKPLELKIFEKEIQSELIMMEQQTYSSQEAEIRNRYQGEQTSLSNTIGQLKNEIVEKEAGRDKLVQSAQAEADGTGGTMKRNAGPIYRIKKADADKAEQELTDTRLRNQDMIDRLNVQITKYDSIIASGIGSLARQKLDGPASRMEALSRLTENSTAIFLANIFIILLFISIETAPVFVKLISNKGPYDDLIRTEEHQYHIDQLQFIARKNAEMKDANEPLRTQEKDFLTTQLDATLK